MTGCGTRLARLLALGLAGLFILLMPAGILLHALGSVLFSSDRMASVLTENLVTSGRLQRLVVEAMLVQGGGALAGFQGGEGGAPSEEAGQGAEFLSYLDETERGRIVAILLNPEWTTAWIESAVSGFFEWIDSEDAAPRLQLDLAPLRDRLSNGGLEEIIGLLVGSWPACTTDQLAEMETARAAGEGAPYLVCEPSQGPIRSALMAYMDSAFRGQLDALPDSSVTATTGTELAVDPQAAQMKGPVRALRALAAWGWLAPAALLGLIVALAVRSWRGLTAWWGFPLLLAGLMTGALVALGDRQISALVEQALPRMEAPEAFRELASAIAGSLRAQVRATTLGEAGLAAIFGLALTLLGTIVTRTRPHSHSGTTKAPRIDSLKSSMADESDSDKPSGLFG